MSPRAKRAASVVTTAPCRVDLAGGTVDIWPLYLFHRGAVTVNFAVNVLTTCRVSPLSGRRVHLISKDTGREETFSNYDDLCSAKGYRHPLAAYLVRFFAPEGGVEVETNSESPAGAGISGSSALMIATTAALARYTGRRFDREQMRVLAQNVEAQLINVPTGCQDYYPALYGGIEALHLEPDGIHREALPVPPGDLDRRFVLVYTGAPRQSGINNWEVFKSHVNGDKKVFHNFDEIVSIARSMRDALIKADWEEVSKLLRAEWKLRKTNAPAISTPEIEELMKVAWRWGGEAAKVCGAGGGGCVVFLVEPEARQRVIEALRNHGAQVLPAKVARDGLTYATAHQA